MSAFDSIKEPPARAFSSDHLRQLVDDFRYGLVVISQASAVQLWNQWLAERTGVDTFAIRGRKLTALFPELQSEPLYTGFYQQLGNVGEGFVYSRDESPELLARFENALGLSPQGCVSRLVCRPMRHGDSTMVWLEIHTSEGESPTPRQKFEAVQREAASSHHQFPVNLESRDFGLITVDGFGFIEAINQTMLEMVGFEEQDLLDKPLRILFPDVSEVTAGDNFRNLIASVCRQNPDGFLEAVSLDGAAIKFSVRVFDSTDSADKWTLSCMDVTRKIDSENKLHRQSELLGALYSNVADAVMVLDRRGELETINPVASEMLALGERRLVHVHIDDVLELKDAQGNRVKPFAESLQRERTINMVNDISLTLPVGTTVPVMVTATPVRDKYNNISGCVIVMRAVSESRRVSTRLSWHETHDPLTQLANRRQIENEVVAAIDQAHVDDVCHGLLYIDLYNFSLINDACGHAAGDELLRQFARLLTEAVGDHDVVARTGNDEFAVLMWNCASEQVLVEAEKVLQVISGYSLPWQGRRLKVGASIGVEVITPQSTSEVDVLLAARASCAIARENGRNRIHFPSQGKDAESRYNLSQWTSSITDALDEDRFVVYLQPIVSLQGETAVQHFEALVRMVDREGKIIPPGKFIPAAESSGLIDDIDRWVFEKVLSTLESLPTEKRSKFSVSVNLSGNTISDEKFLAHVVERLRNAHLEPGVLQFEITETAAVKHFDRAIYFIRALNDLGCKFSLDDFGSGLSSFGYLKQLPVDHLKIDGSFVRKMELEDVEYSMVSTINHLAHVMDLKTIAECVENQAQMTMLKEMGVDYGQGFLFSAPEPLDRIFQLN